MPPLSSLYGAVEAGGTKFLCAVGTMPDDLHETIRIATTTPEDTLGQVIDFFRRYRDQLHAVGIGSFGPVDLAPSSTTFGHLLHTPKRGWADVDLRGTIQEALDVPIALDTDVNAAALAEARWGTGRSVDTFLYLTVGTGIGGSVVQDGACLHGLAHPEMGHIRVPRAPNDTFEGVCDHHDDCLEGLASGPALAARWGCDPERLPDDHPAWTIQAHYLAQACATFVYTLVPERIVLGGGIMQRSHLFPLIRSRLKRLIAGYPDVQPLSGSLDAYVVPPALGTYAGLLGALALAEQAHPISVRSPDASL